MKDRVYRKRQYQNLKEERDLHTMGRDEERIFKKQDLRRLYNLEYNSEMTKIIAEGWGLSIIEVEVLTRLAMHTHAGKHGFTCDEQRLFRQMRSKAL